MDNIMIDLETLGTSPTSIVVSLGAVWFGENGLGAEFYGVFDIADQGKYGRTMNPDTIKWWMQQSPAAQAVFRHAPTKTAKILADFVDFFGDIKNVVKVWGYGSDFDCVILRSLYDTFGVQAPWSYKNTRCFRTLVAENSHVPAPTRDGVHHNALDDAKYQAAWASLIKRQGNAKST
jgi:hypothetical protein